MAVKTGDRLTFADIGVEVIVTTGGDAEVTAVPAGDALLPGKRFKCETTGIQVLVVKPGPASLECNGAPMVLQEPKKTKAAD